MARNGKKGLDLSATEIAEISTRLNKVENAQRGILETLSEIREIQITAGLRQFPPKKRVTRKG